MRAASPLLWARLWKADMTAPRRPKDRMPPDRMPPDWPFRAQTRRIAARPHDWNLIDTGGDGASDSGTCNNKPPVQHNGAAAAGLQHLNKIYHRVPPTWKFPLLNLQPMYVYWHCGN